MDNKKNFAFHINANDFNQVKFSGAMNNVIDIYILCKYSFNKNYQNIDVGKLVNKKFSPNEIYNLYLNGVKTNFTFEQIMSFKKNNIDFYIVDRERLSTIFLNQDINKCISNIQFFQIKGQYILSIDYCYFISFKPGNNTNNIINENQKYKNIQININANNITENNMINNNNNSNFNNNNNIFDTSNNNFNNEIFAQPQGQQQNSIINNDNITANGKKTKILEFLILLYGNEKEILRLYSQGIYAAKQFHLINKTFIDKFKEIYHYNEISNILSMKGINTINDTLTNMKSYLSLDEIKTFTYQINMDSYSLTQFNSKPEIKIMGEFSEYKFPVNFVIIQESLLNSLKKFMKIEANSEYEINFGKASLCLRWNFDHDKIYIYNYNNNSKNMIITGIIEVFGDIWKEIFDRHLSKNTFTEYLTGKNINLNLIKQKQNLLSKGNKHLGYIYLINQLRNSMVEFNNNLQENQITPNFNQPLSKTVNEINSNKNKKTEFHSIFQNIIISLNSLKYNTLDVLSIETIKSYIDINFLMYLQIFIVETRKLNYCLTLMEQTKGIITDFSGVFTENDIISCDKIDEAKKYSFINDEFCKYFQIQNINDISKGFLFINKAGSEKKVIYVYYQKENCLLKVENYFQNSFKLKKLSKPKSDTEYLTDDNTTQSIPPEIPSTPSEHSLGLENIGATCYMNATLQCLCHVNSIKDYFLNDNIYNQEIAIKPGSLTKCFADVLRKIWSQTYEQSYAPREFKNKISIMNPLFKGIQANDSKDLVLFIYENIHSELNNPSQNPNQINLTNIPNELIQFRQNYYPQNYSIILKTFYYEQSSVLQCQNCSYKTFNFNIMNIIIFPLEKIRLYMEKKNPNGFSVVTLYDCFDQNQQPELLSGSNQIYCNNCHQNANALSYNQLYTCPEVLTIILNRGKGIQFDVNFSFPMELTIQNYVIEKTCDPNYELIGVLTHFGPSGMAGHFVAYCKSPINDRWYLYNDSIVTPCNSDVESEMQSNGIPYILFYQRRKNEMTNGKYEEKKCIYFTYEGKEGYFEYTDENSKMLYEAYEEFKKKYAWAPQNGRLMLMKNNNMIDLDNYQSIAGNGINNGDKICIIVD